MTKWLPLIGAVESKKAMPIDACVKIVSDVQTPSLQGPPCP